MLVSSLRWWTVISTPAPALWSRKTKVSAARVTCNPININIYSSPPRTLFRVHEASCHVLHVLLHVSAVIMLLAIESFLVESTLQLHCGPGMSCSPAAPRTSIL